MFLIVLLGMLIMLITLLLNIYHLALHTNKRKKLSNYFWDDPHLYKEGVDGIIRHCVPNHEYRQILRKRHSEAYGGHHGGDRTAHKVSQSGFYWPTLFKDARKYVSSCDECQRIGNIGKRQEIPMNYSLAVEPFDVLGFDYMGPFPSSNGYTHILVVVDYVTKWVEAIPTSNANHNCDAPDLTVH